MAKKDKTKQKYGGKNPWAICHSSTGPKKTKKFERCVMHVKHEEGTIYQRIYNLLIEGSLGFMKLERQHKKYFKSQNKIINSHPNDLGTRIVANSNRSSALQTGDKLRQNLRAKKYAKRTGEGLFPKGRKRGIGLP